MSKLSIKNNISTELIIEHKDNEPAKALNTGDLNYKRATVDELASIIPAGATVAAYDGEVCVVTDIDRGGTFVFDNTQASTDNGEQCLAVGLDNTQVQ